MKTTKRILSALMAVLMVLSVFPAGIITLGAVDISLDASDEDDVNSRVGRGFNLLDEASDLSVGYLMERIFHSFNGAWIDNEPVSSAHFEYLCINDTSEFARNESASLSMGLDMSAGYAGVSAKIKAQYGLKASLGASGSESMEYVILSGKYHRQIARLLLPNDMNEVWEKKEDGSYRYLRQDFVDDLYAYTVSAEQFFERYGTHVLIAYTDGAEAYMVYQGQKLTSAMNSSSETEMNVSTGVSASTFADINLSLDTAYSESQNNANSNSNITYTADVRGGTAGISFDPASIKDGTALKNWGSNLVGDIMLDQNLKLMPIWDFIVDAEHFDRKVELEEYFNKQISAQNAEFYSDYIYSGVGQFDYSDFTAISTPEDFNTLLRSNLGGKYVLLCDIDLSSYGNWTPIGTKDAPFWGTLCGNGNTVTGLQITACADGLAGLFGANAGTIRNLAVEGAIEVDASGSPDSVAYVGGIVGYNTGSIVNCKSDVTVNGEMQVEDVGVSGAGSVSGLFGLTGDAEKALQDAIDDAIKNAKPVTGDFEVKDEPIKLTGTLNDVEIVITGSAKPAFIVLEDADFTGIIKSVGDNIRDVYIISMGNENTIKGMTAHTPLYVRQAGVYITGDAPLTVIGGDKKTPSTPGEKGGDGVWGADVKALFVDAKSVTIIGGDGADGANGYAGSNGSNGSKASGGSDHKGYTGGQGGNGAAGGSGGNGGNGALAIGPRVLLTVYNGDVELCSGSGGNGGNGGKGGNGGCGGEGANGFKGNSFLDGGYYHGGDGGNGGNGGKGGDGGHGGLHGPFASSIQFVLHGSATVTQTLGVYGNGGNGGDGGEGGDGGDGADCSDGYWGKHTPGGNGGDGGDGGQAGKGGNGLSAGDAGQSGAWGALGFRAGNYNGCGCSLDVGDVGHWGKENTAGTALIYTGTLAILKTSTTEYTLNNTSLTWEEANRSADVQGNQKVDWESVFVRGERAFSAYGAGAGSSGAVTTTLVKGNPLGYGWTMKITSKTYDADWHYGGYHHTVMTYPGATFIWKIYAKVPAGYYIYPYSNYLGDNGENYCLTDNNGTGDWKWYYFATQAGLTEEWGHFDTLGFVAIRSHDFDTLTKEEERNPTWEVAYSNIFEVSGPLALSSLVSIGSAAEQALVEKLVSAAGGGEYWIGLKRQANSGADFEKFTWSDGTKTQIVKTDDITKSYEIDHNGNILDEVYSNWLNGEPDNNSKDEEDKSEAKQEDYVGLYTNNQWADFASDYRMGFITEKRIASSTNTLDANALFVGGICGFNAERGTIEKVYNTGNINQSNEIDGETKTYKIGTENGGVSAYSGGIAGYSEGVIDGAKNTGNVYAYAESGSAYRYADAYAYGIAYGIANKAQNYYSKETVTVLATARSVNNLKTIVSEAQKGSVQGLPAEIENNWPEGHSFRLERVSRTDYFVDQKFDPSTVTLTFDGVDVWSNFDVRYNFYKPGHTNVSLIYEKDGKKYTKILPVYVQEASPVSISLNEEKSAYFKASYLKGETFCTDGLIFTLTYDNGDTVNIPFKKDSFRIDLPNMNLVGEQTLTVVYVADEVNPLSCTVTICVDSIRTIGIQIAQLPNKTSYYPKQEVDWTGMVIERVKNDGSVEVIDIEREIEAGTLKPEYEFKNEGESTVTVIVDEVYTASFTCTVLPVAESDLPRLEVSNASGSAGYTVQLAVNIKNNPGFGGMGLSYEYDKSVMTLTNVTCSQDVFALSHDKVTVLDAADNWKEDGELVILTFEIAKNAPEGKYNVAIRVNEAYEYTDSGLETVDFYTVDGTLSIVELIYGDANGDGMVSLSDILQIRRHLASRDPFTGISTIWVGVGADANGDGVINTKDLVLVRKCVASIDPDTKEPSFILGPAA